MPATSKAQAAAMHAAAEGRSTIGIPQSVGREFVNAQAPGSVKNLPERVKPRDHALVMASANHLHRMGHITSAQHKQITAAAQAGLAKAKKPTFGAIG